MDLTELGVYVAFRSCGCVAAIISDLKEDSKWTGREVGKLIKNGYRVERFTAETYRTSSLMYKCPHRQAPLLEQSELFA